MALSWAQKKQIKIFIFLAIFVFAVVGFIIYILRPAPTCFDAKQNQNEEGIDCGGECEACVIDPKNLIITWARPFELSEGHYEAAAFIENPNIEYGSRAVSYQFVLLNGTQIVGSKEGKTFINPREKFVIYENDISTGGKKATSARIEFREIRWRKVEAPKENILISSKNFNNSPNGNAHLVLRNQSLFPVRDIYASIVLKDGAGNAIGVSSTKIDIIKAEASKDVFFTWREPIFAASSDAYVRTNLTE